MQKAAKNIMLLDGRTVESAVNTHLNTSFVESYNPLTLWSFIYDGTYADNIAKNVPAADVKIQNSTAHESLDELIPPCFNG